MHDRRHSQNMIQSNGMCALDIIYKLCYGKSQKCTVLQKQHGIHLCMNHLSQEGLDTERRIGNTVSSKTVNNKIIRFAKIVIQHHHCTENFHRLTSLEEDTPVYENPSTLCHLCFCTCKFNPFLLVPNPLFMKTCFTLRITFEKQYVVNIIQKQYMADDFR